MNNIADERVLNEVNRDRVVTLLQEMVRIKSYTDEELELAEFMADWLRKQGLEVNLQECTPTKYHKKSANVIAILKGTGGGQNLILNGHLDTDPACGDWTYDPWDPVIFDGNKLNGLGTTNMKTGDAAMVEAVLAIKDAGIRLKGDILLTLVCRELQGGWGTHRVLEEYTADFGIVTERTFFKIGFNPSMAIIHPQIQIYGKTAHVHEPQKAICATTKMGEVITALSRLDFPYTREAAPPEHGNYPVMAIGAARSGVGENFYDGRPATIGDRAVIKMDVRLDRNQTEEMVYKDIQDVLDRMSSEDPQLKTKLEPMPTYINRPFYELPMDSYIIHVINRAHQRIIGEEVGRLPSTGGTDAAVLTEAGIPTAVYGYGGGSLKYPDMFVDVPDLYTNIDELPNLAKVLALSCLETCNTPKKQA